jgi:hypothetical protein
MNQWPTNRKAAVAIWGITLFGYLLFVGIPFDRASQLIIILSGALAFSVGTDHGALRIFADWIPFFFLLYAYDFSRGAADQFGRPILIGQLYDLELAWFGIDGQIPTVWLQQHIYNPDSIAIWESLVALMYTSHFVVPWAIIGTLYVRNRDLWKKFARRIIVISMSALITYIAFPAAPPWYAAREGFTDEIFRISTRGWSALGIPIAGQIISLGQGVVNQVAAIPSLHAGMAILISIFFWKRSKLPMKFFLVFYMLGMTFTLVYGGEHYILDALLGGIYALAVEYSCRLWEKRKYDLSTSKR